MSSITAFPYFYHSPVTIHYSRSLHFRDSGDPFSITVSILSNILHPAVAGDSHIQNVPVAPSLSERGIWNRRPIRTALQQSPISETLETHSAQRFRYLLRFSSNSYDNSLSLPLTDNPATAGVFWHPPPIRTALQQDQIPEGLETHSAQPFLFTTIRLPRSRKTPAFQSF